MSAPHGQRRLDPATAGVVAVCALLPLSVLASYMMIRNRGQSCIAQDCPERRHEGPVWWSVSIYYAFLLTMAVVTFVFQRAPVFYGHSLKTKRLSLPWSVGPGILLSEVVVWAAVSVLQTAQFAIWFYIYGLSRDDIFGEDRGEPTVLGMDWVDWKIVYKVLGYPAAIQLALTLLPTSRAGILSSVFRIPFDVALSFHRASGWLAVAFCAAHGVAFCVFALLRGGVKLLMLYFFFWGADERRWRSYKGWVEAVGLISFLLFSWVAFNSLEKVRRRTFNWFYFNHFAVLGAIVGSFIHASPVIHYGLPALALYVADGFVRVFNRSVAFEAGKLVVEACGYIRMDILDCDLHAKPGQWVSINVPAISKSEWHPFTVVSSAPAMPTLISSPVPPLPSESTPLLMQAASASIITSPESESTGMTLIIKPAASEKSWTRSLIRAYNESKNADEEAHRGHLKVHIEGPYGSLPPNFLNSPYLLVLVGGSGVPGGICLARAALARSSTQRVKFVWTTREDSAGELSSFRELLEFGKRGVGAGKLDAEVILTGRGRGRVDVDEVVYSFVQSVGRGHPGAMVSVYGCGPSSLERAVRGATSARRCRDSGVKLIAQIEGYAR
ncbi:ferric/cupric-chelate reductase [Rhizophlyctis rosea]|nr:ferric/cupric-chelate reductase [Rhizophlyctis rosea]